MSDSVNNTVNSSEAGAVGTATKSSSPLIRGVVKWFNDAKGFGFIEHETGKDVFVHYSVIETEGFKTLKDGEEVNYELKEGDKGLHAARVLRPNAPPPQKKKESATKPVQLGTSELVLERTSISEDEEILGTAIVERQDSASTES
jgi:CspA family cold shock protein